MYINISILESKGLTLEEFAWLQLFKQNKLFDCTEYLSNVTQKTLNKFIDLELINNTKKGKMYTSTKGTEWLDDINTVGVTEGDIKMRDYLCEMYLSHTDKDRKIGNKKKVGEYCATLRNYLNFDLHQFYYLSEYYLENFEYTKVLEYIFFNPNKFRYAKFKNHIEDSSIYQYYEENKEEILKYIDKKCQ